MRFFGIFGCGALYFLYRDSIKYDWRLAAVGSLSLAGLMFSRHLAEPAVAIVGGYIVFWFAFNVQSKSLASIGKRVDLSYGVYLYAWPVQKIFIQISPSISPWLLSFYTTLI